MGRRGPRERIWGALEARASSSHARSSSLIRGGERLLDREPVLQASIDRRNPYVDPLSFIQIELLRRLRRGRAGAGGRPEQLGRVSLLAINGIASGLRNTG